jgi:hypothetical protein
MTSARPRGTVLSRIARVTLTVLASRALFWFVRAIRAIQSVFAFLWTSVRAGAGKVRRRLRYGRGGTRWRRALHIRRIGPP